MPTGGKKGQKEEEENDRERERTENDRERERTDNDRERERTEKERRTAMTENVECGFFFFWKTNIRQIS